MTEFDVENGRSAAQDATQSKGYAWDHVVNQDFHAAQKIFRDSQGLKDNDPVANERYIQDLLKYQSDNHQSRQFQAVDTDHNGKPDSLIGVVEKNGTTGKAELIFDNPYNDLDKQYYPKGPARK
jgi:hypothetical protein